MAQGQADRVNYLMTRQAKVVAMTCTHAALKRREFLELAFQYDSLVMEESAQILEIETFIPMLLQARALNSPPTLLSSSKPAPKLTAAQKPTPLLCMRNFCALHSSWFAAGCLVFPLLRVCRLPFPQQKPEGGRSRLKRVVMIGDHHQLPPVVKNMAFQKYAHLDQSLFTRFVRLGTPYLELNAQVRQCSRLLLRLQNRNRWKLQRFCLWNLCGICCHTEGVLNPKTAVASPAWNLRRCPRLHRTALLPRESPCCLLEHEARAHALLWCWACRGGRGPAWRSCTTGATGSWATSPTSSPSQ